MPLVNLRKLEGVAGLDEEERKVARHIAEMIYQPEVMERETVEVAGKKFVIRLLDRDEHEDVSRISGRDDMLTRVLVEQRETVARAVVEIDGVGVTQAIMDAILRTAQPQLVAVLWDKYLTLRSAQEVTLHQLGEAVKK